MMLFRIYLVLVSAFLSVNILSMDMRVAPGEKFIKITYIYKPKPKQASMPRAASPIPKLDDFYCMTDEKPASPLAQSELAVFKGQLKFARSPKKTNSPKNITQYHVAQNVLLNNNFKQALALDLLILENSRTL